MTHFSAHDRDLIKSFLADHGIKRVNERAALKKLVQAVSAIPWGEGRTIEDVLQSEKVGTCTGKHLVLEAGLQELGIACRSVVCTFRWQDQEIRFPQRLKDILTKHTWLHAHNFIQVQNSSAEWIDVDVTWDGDLRRHGFRVLPSDWDGEHPFVGLIILERWDGIDMHSKKDELLHMLTDDQRHAREQFLRGFIAWIQSLRREEKES